MSKMDNGTNFHMDQGCSLVGLLLHFFSMLTVSGNLLSERVTKRDIFATFYQYGKLAQISIKQAFGFVQFLHPESCNEALTREQGAMLRGRKMRK